jgi:hypothetical protein
MKLRLSCAATGFSVKLLAATLERQARFSKETLWRESSKVDFLTMHVGIPNHFLQFRLVMCPAFQIFVYGLCVGWLLG